MSFKFNGFTGTLDIINKKSSGGLLGPEPHIGSEVIASQLVCTIIPKQVIMERQTLIPIKDYSVSGNTITFVIDVDPSNTIVVFG